MIPVRQTELSTPSSRYSSTTTKTVFGLPGVFLGLLLPLGLLGNAALGSCHYNCDCSEQELGKEYCDQFCATFEKNCDDDRPDPNNYGWDVCNESSNTVYAAYASAYEGYGYTRKGWYTINPGKCRRVITESMADKNYYVRIEQSNGYSQTKNEEPFCMWPPQSPRSDGNDAIYEASLRTCRNWKVGNKSFERMPKGNGFVTTIR